MARKPKDRSADRHKPSKLVRIRGAFTAPLAELAERNATDPTEETNRAVRELLEREGLWPLKAPGD